MLLLLLFYFLLSWLHFKFIINYDDFNYVAFSQDINFRLIWYRYLIVTLLFLLSNIFLLYIKVSNFLFSILYLILFFFVMPSGLLFASSSAINPEIFISHNLFFISIYLGSLIKWNLNFPQLNTYQSTLLLLSVTVIGLIPFIISYGPYINIKNLWLSDVYETRRLVAEKINNVYTAYTYSWFSKIIIPIALVFSIYFRKKAFLLFSIFSLLFLYLCGAHKTVFLGTLLIIGFYKYDYLRKTFYFIKVITLFLVVALLCALIFEFNILWELSFRRVLMLSALLDYCYFDFFHDNYIYWSNSFMSRFISYPYEISPDFLIGRDYFNRPLMNANVGIISDGYKNAGYWGIGINIAVVAIIISFFNSLRISPKFFGLFLLFLFSLLNSSLTTILLTHGGFLMVLIAAFLLKDTELKLI
ncbi:hypothetical protein SAMN04487891_101539 [Flagellimonas taeanensis]|uniref:Oligosaccharide repeat unit polymerase n=1 Tax=Flagellimonas taeanensis TaxID=1005926 RepID=A0A1M6QCV6_9FLAO|nr:hypothetical protein SAMN04487891_101539 [Allomuricauda taeanensis]SHK18005.1 hypothetical protein SAMN05216293_0546 [Allomuricauda taeanensis]